MSENRNSKSDCSATAEKFPNQKSNTVNIDFRNMKSLYIQRSLSRCFNNGSIHEALDSSKKMRLLLSFAIIFIVIIETRSQDFKLTTQVEESNIDGEDVGHMVTTEQVIDPKIKVVNSADIEEDEEEADPSWDKNLAIRDVAYFLRAHKFEDYDRRYFTEISESPRRHFQEFPKPQLKVLHWEVHKECEAGFVQCLKYLQRIANLTALRREGDTVTVMWENNWSLTNNTQQIFRAQKECQMSQKRDEITHVPFRGPLGKETIYLYFFS